MPEDLTDSQIEELHSDLIRVQRELQEAIDVHADHASIVNLDQDAVGRLSRIDAIQQQQMAAEIRRRTTLRSKQVAVALGTHGEGEYGWCKKCGEPIGYKRLKAKPESPCCVPCTSAMGR
jgi:DnaK suppressor protein